MQGATELPGRAPQQRHHVAVAATRGGGAALRWCSGVAPMSRLLGALAAQPRTRAAALRHHPCTARDTLRGTLFTWETGAHLGACQRAERRGPAAYRCVAVSAREASTPHCSHTIVAVRQWVWTPGHEIGRVGLLSV